MAISVELSNRPPCEACSGQDWTSADATGRGTGTFDYNLPIVITAMTINAAQRRIALGIVILLFVIGLATAPFAGLPAARVDTFLPVLQTVLCLVDLITAFLLFSQYSVRPRYAGLAIASGYLLSGLFAFARAFQRLAIAQWV
jgi:hypothetical protein